MASYEKRPSGLWSVRFSIPSADGSDKLKRLSGFKTKKEAQYAYEDFMASFRAEPLPTLDTPPAAPDVLDMTFSELVTKYFAYQKPRLKDQSYYDLTQKVKSKLVTFFGDKKMRDITPLTILANLIGNVAGDVD